MIPKDLDKLIKNYLQGKSNKEEAKFIDTWYSSLGKNTPVLPLSEKEAGSVENRILENLKKHTNTTFPDNKNTRHIPLWQWCAMAASLLLFISAGYFYSLGTASDQVASEKKSDQFITIKNSEAHAKRAMLPDGSIVSLSKSSEIRFVNDPNSASRELFLKGEAYFDVAHDKERPFYVYAGDMVTKVLGTSFNVNAFDKNGNVTVTVKTGKVSVYSINAAHKKVVLIPNQEAVYNKTKNALATHSVNELKTIDLIKQQQLSEIRFDETPVSEVLTRLGTDYDIEIIFNEDSLDGCVLTSTFVEEGFYDRMDAVCTAIGATYKIVDARVMIESNGCKNIKTNNEDE